MNGYLLDIIDPDALEACRQEGKGWQSRIDDMLFKNMPRHKRRGRIARITLGEH